MRNIKCLVTSGLLLIALCSNAASYFVDKTGGSDLNSGKSIQMPWKSFSNIYSKRLNFLPGDTIFLKGGEVWNELLNLQLTGSSTAPIVVAGYGTGRPIVRGITNALQAVEMLNCSYTEIKDIEIDGSQLGTVAVCGLSIAANNGRILKGLIVKNLYIHDVNGTHVKANGGGAGIIVKRLATNSLFDGLLIENNLIRRCSRNGIVFNSKGFSSRLEWQPSLNVVIRSNVLEQVPGDGIVPVACNKALVEYNVMRDCSPLLLGEAAAGIWPWGSDSTIIQYNEVSGHRAYWDGQGFDADYNCIGTVIQYNYSHDNDGGFLLVCCDGTSLGKSWNIGTIGTVVRFNVSINDGIRNEKTHSGTYFSPIIHITGPTENTQIYNNLMYYKLKPSANVDKNMVTFGNWGGTYPKATGIYNNIFYVENGASSSYKIPAAAATTTTFSNNLYYGSQTAKPVDNNQLTTNPLFAGNLPATREERDGFNFLSCFKLTANSPCIEKGFTISDAASVRDFFGNYLQTGSKPSIGIHYANESTGISYKTIENTSVIPNPVLKNAIVKFELLHSTVAVITLHDSNGKLVFKKIGDFQTGLQSFYLDMDNLSTGIYILSINADKEHFQQKIAKG